MIPPADRELLPGIVVQSLQVGGGTRGGAVGRWASPPVGGRRRPDIPFVNLREVDTFGTDPIDEVRQ